MADAKGRSDKGKSRCFPPDAIASIEGLALQKPPRSMAAIHRQVTTVAFEQRFRQLQVVTKEVVETARQNLIIGPG